MSKIVVLDELTAAQIAAGEVIERPASVVKETVENSIDAGATKIQVEIRGGGVKFIRVIDNGCGFEPDDAVIAFDKHATSKIRSGADLDNIHTLGFRGEALASIAGIADVELLSRTENDAEGMFVHIKGGEVLAAEKRGCQKGTRLTVKDLFYNTPARYKFLKKDQTETGYVTAALQKIAMANPGVAFSLISGGQEIFRTPGDGNLRSVIYSIFGREAAEKLLPLSYSENGYSVTGFVSVRENVYSTRARQIFFVNGRNVRNTTVTSALDEAFKTVTMKHKFPMAILDIRVPGGKVDVNVHPAKTEVRFADEQAVFSLIHKAASNALFVDNAVDNSPKGSNYTQADGKSEQFAYSVHNNRQDEGKIPQTPPKSNILPEETRKFTEILEENCKFVNDFTPNVRDTGNIYGKCDISADKKAVQTQEKPVDNLVDNPVDNVVDNSAAKAVDKPVDIPVDKPLTPCGKRVDKPVETVPEIPVEPKAMTLPGLTEEKAYTYNEKDVFTDSRIIGQLMDTYILLEKDNKLIMIDQHAAHERLKYEELKKSLEDAGHNPVVSPMLLPLTLRLTPSEYIRMTESMEYFNNIGFEIDDFGKNTVIIRAVPSILDEGDPEELIVSALEAMEEPGKTKGAASMISDNVIFTMACKAAIKANMKLTEGEIKALLRKLAALDYAGTCPHGRPVFVEITQHEIEKRFKRCL